MTDLWHLSVRVLLVLVLAIGLCRTRANAALVEEPPLVLTYHKGPLLSTKIIGVHVIWYGKFSPVQRSIVADYLQSLAAKLQGKDKQPSVSTWWENIAKYKSAASNNKAALGVARLGKQKMDDSYSLGKLLKRTDIAALVESAVKSRALPPPARHTNAVYLVLTSDDVAVERFCVSSCGYHEKTKGSRLAYAWVGNAVSQCPGQCAWPFHQPLYGPQTPPLVSPNADVGIDGMIINIATVLVGAVTNPFHTGYFQGDAAAPLEAVSACAGMYGNGAYPGYPGEVLVERTTGASYNAHGLNGRQFLLRPCGILLPSTAAHWSKK